MCACIAKMHRSQLKSYFCNIEVFIVGKRSILVQHVAGCQYIIHKYKNVASIYGYVCVNVLAMKNAAARVTKYVYNGNMKTCHYPHT